MDKQVYNELDKAGEALNSIQAEISDLAWALTNTRHLISGNIEQQIWVAEQQINEADSHFNAIARILVDPSLPPSMKLEQIQRMVNIYRTLYPKDQD